MNQDLCIKIDNLSNIQRKKEIEKTLQKIQNKYVGAPIKESTQTALNHDITEVLRYIMDNYPEERLKVDFKGGVAYHEERWTITDILTAYKKCYPNRYNKNKKEYTRREVNNMLFNLQSIGYLESYTQVTYPDITFSSNNEIFDDVITVRCQFIATEYWSKIEEE